MSHGPAGLQAWVTTTLTATQTASTSPAPAGSPCPSPFPRTTRWPAASPPSCSSCRNLINTRCASLNLWLFVARHCGEAFSFRAVQRKKEPSRLDTFFLGQVLNSDGAAIEAPADPCPPMTKVHPNISPGGVVVGFGCGAVLSLSLWADYSLSVGRLFSLSLSL